MLCARALGCTPGRVTRQRADRHASRAHRVAGEPTEARNLWSPLAYSPSGVGWPGRPNVAGLHARVRGAAMTRTRVVFIVLVAVVLVVVGVSYATQRWGTVQLSKPEQLSVRIVCALPVEPFVREAAERFNAEKHTLDGRLIQVSIVPMDGLVAMSRWERGEMAGAEEGASVPTVWIPDSRYLVELVNATLKEQRGRDIFLTGGEYRARPIAISLFCWGIWDSRVKALESKYGNDIGWQDIHDAATAKGGWPELGGQAEWGYFKLVVPNPRKNVGGLMAMVAAAGEYHGKTRIEVADVTDPDFQAWL
ncbi:MAG: hypothetical protein FJZ90_08980, partial [Chloroflexi bacterium]|nr:hypothetical protein [Chloroflexota bacterium]